MSTSTTASNAVNAEPEKLNVSIERRPLTQPLWTPSSSELPEWKRLPTDTTSITLPEASKDDVGSLSTCHSTAVCGKIGT